MENIGTGTTLVVNSVKVSGVALIATKIDIPSAIFFLVFFSFIHSLVVLHYSRKSEDEKDVVGFYDFLILMIIALGSGMVFMILGIMSWRDELTIYTFGIFGSLLGVKGINAFLNFFSKKVGVDLNDK